MEHLSLFCLSAFKLFGAIITVHLRLLLFHQMQWRLHLLAVSAYSSNKLNNSNKLMCDVFVSMAPSVEGMKPEG